VNQCGRPEGDIRGCRCVGGHQLRRVKAELSIDEGQEGGRVFQLAQIKARLQLVVAVGQRQVVGVLKGFDRTGLRQVCGRADVKQRGSPDIKVRHEVGQSLVNVVGGRNLSLATG